MKVMKPQSLRIHACVKRRDVVIYFVEAVRVVSAIGGLPAFRAAQLRCDCLETQAAANCGYRPSFNAKNPPRISADGFWARRMSLNKAPPFTGPVNRGSTFLSTGGGKLLSLKIRRSKRSSDEPPGRANAAR
jgi:hypothetical protein